MKKLTIKKIMVALGLFAVTSTGFELMASCTGLSTLEFKPQIGACGPSNPRLHYKCD
jgi:hypothetical protein